MSARHPEEYIHGSQVVLPARAALWLERNANLTDLRSKAQHSDPEIYNCLAALRIAAMRHREAEPTKKIDPEYWLSTRQMADRLGMSMRGVTKRIQAGQLVAQRHGGQWFIDPASLAQR